MSDPSPDSRPPLSHLRHDLRTPINQIIGYSELLMEEAGDAGHGAYDADLKKINGAAKTLLGLINENLTDDRLTLSSDVAEKAKDTANSLSANPASYGAGLSYAVQNGADEIGSHVTSPGHILVVDDQAGNRDMLSRQLVRQGHTVSSAENGRAALDLLKATPVDLVLLDMM